MIIGGSNYEDVKLEPEDCYTIDILIHGLIGSVFDHENLEESKIILRKLYGNLLFYKICPLDGAALGKG